MSIDISGEAEHWLPKARRMRDGGASWKMIGRRLGVGAKTARRHVLGIIDETPRAKVAARNERIAAEREAAERAAPRDLTVSEQNMAVARAFAAGEIDRLELCVRLRRIASAHAARQHP